MKTKKLSPSKNNYLASNVGIKSGVKSELKQHKDKVRSSLEILATKKIHSNLLIGTNRKNSIIESTMCLVDRIIIQSPERKTN